MRNRVFFHRRLLLAVCAGALLWSGAPLAVPASADPAPIKIAVFDFELDDSSAGAGIAGDPAADLTQLDRVTSEARRLISDSGRYRLVDVASAEGEGVKSRSLRQCNGCEAAIALKLRVSARWRLRSRCTAAVSAISHPLLRRSRRRPDD